MSKILYPSLRLGFMVAPPQLVDTLVKVRAVMDQHSPAIDQATLARFMTEGFFPKPCETDPRTLCPATRILYRTIPKMAGRLFRSGSDAGRFALHRLAAARGRFPVIHGVLASKPASGPALFLSSALRLSWIRHSSLDLRPGRKRKLNKVWQNWHRRLNK